MNVDPVTIYDKDYYATHCGPLPYARSTPEFVALFNAIAEELIRVFRPVRAFDAGCAHGFLVEGLRDRGVEAWGRDISPYAISQVRPDMGPFCTVGSLAEPLPDRFDVVTCIEVLEHMPVAEGLAAIANLARASDTIVVSSSPDDFDEPTHINVQPPLYWMRAFAEHGFEPDVEPVLQNLPSYTLTLRRSDAKPSATHLQACSGLVHARIEIEKLVKASERLKQFDPRYYLATHADVAVSGMDALEHYIRFGRFEGRYANARLAETVESIVAGGVGALRPKLP